MSFKIFCSSTNSLNCQSVGPPGPPGPQQFDFGTYTPTTPIVFPELPDITSVFSPQDQQLSNFVINSEWSYIVIGDLVTVKGTVQCDCGTTDPQDPGNFPAFTSLYIRHINNYPINENPQVINGFVSGGDGTQTPHPIISSITVGTEPTYEYIKFILRTNDKSFWVGQQNQYLNVSFTYKTILPL